MLVDGEPGDHRAARHLGRRPLVRVAVRAHRRSAGGAARRSRSSAGTGASRPRPTSRRTRCGRSARAAGARTIRPRSLLGLHGSWKVGTLPGLPANPLLCGALGTVREGETHACTVEADRWSRGNRRAGHRRRYRHRRRVRARRRRRRRRGHHLRAHRSHAPGVGREDQRRRRERRQHPLRRRRRHQRGRRRAHRRRRGRAHGHARRRGRQRRWWRRAHAARRCRRSTSSSG